MGKYDTTKFFMIYNFASFNVTIRLLSLRPWFD